MLDKENAAARKGIFMIDASKGFIKDGNKNRLREQDIHRIVDTFTRQVEIPRYARMVPLDGDRRPEERLQPQPAALHRQHRAGGFAGHRRPPARRHPEPRHRRARALLAGLPRRARRAVRAAGRPGYTQLTLPIAEVKAAIFGHAEFTAFNESATSSSRNGETANTPRLKGIAKDGHPKALIETLSEDLLATFRRRRCSTPTTSTSTSWTTGPRPCRTTVYLIVADGWAKAAQPREIIQVKDKNKKLIWPEKHDYRTASGASSPTSFPRRVHHRPLLCRRTDAIEKLEADLAALEQQLEEMRRGTRRRGGLLAEATRRGRQAEAHRESREGRG